MPAGIRHRRAKGKKEAALRCPRLTFGRNRPCGLQPRAAPSAAEPQPADLRRSRCPGAVGVPRPSVLGSARLCRYTQPPARVSHLSLRQRSAEAAGLPTPAPAEGPAQTRAAAGASAGSGPAWQGGVSHRDAAPAPPSTRSPVTAASRSNPSPRGTTPRHAPTPRRRAGHAGCRGRQPHAWASRRSPTRAQSGAPPGAPGAAAYLGRRRAAGRRGAAGRPRAEAGRGVRRAPPWGRG